MPVQRVGRLTLNRNPDNFFAETEQVAFHLGNVVPGIDFSNDPLLQGRLFSYLDTQLTRLGGPNFHELPINRSVAPVHNNQRDGFMRHTINTGRTSYQPNSLGGGCPFQAGAAHGGFVSFGERVEGQKIRAAQPQLRRPLQPGPPVLGQPVPARAGAPHPRPALRAGQGAGHGRPAADGRPADQRRPRPGDTGGAGHRRAPAGRRRRRRRGERPAAGGLGASTASPPRRARRSPLPVERAPELSMATARGIPSSVAWWPSWRPTASTAPSWPPSRPPWRGRGRTRSWCRLPPSCASRTAPTLPADRTLLTAASVIYDGVFVPGGEASVAGLQVDADAVDFVAEAYKHSKTLGASGEGVDLLMAAMPAARPARQRSGAGDGAAGRRGRRRRRRARRSGHRRRGAGIHRRPGAAPPLLARGGPQRLAGWCPARPPERRGAATGPQPAAPLRLTGQARAGRYRPGAGPARWELRIPSSPSPVPVHRTRRPHRTRHPAGHNGWEAPASPGAGG